MNKIKTALGILLIFLLGSLCGSLVTQSCFRAHPQRPPRFETFTAHQKRFLHHLEKELQLTSQQSRNIDRILMETGQEMHAFFDSNRTTLDKIRDESFNRIKAELTDSQRADFDRLNARMEEHRQAAMEHGFRHLPPPADHLPPDRFDFRHGDHSPGPP